MLRLLLRLVLPMLFGDPDSVRQDETTWPTWVVVLIICLVIAALVGGYFFLAYTRNAAP